MDSLEEEIDVCENEYISKYEEMERIGEGSYGFIVKIRETQTGMIFAKKTIPMGSMKSGVPVSIFHEMQTLLNLHHPNLIHLHKWFLLSKRRELGLILDCAEGDLRWIIRKYKKKVPLDVGRWIMWDILKGLAYMHAHWIMHRDVKPSNLLYFPPVGDESAKMRIGDFGLSRQFRMPIRKLGFDGPVVTLWYRAPELLLGCRDYAESIDLWSVGCVLGELLIGTVMFQGVSGSKGVLIESNQIQTIFSMMGIPSESTWPGGKHLPYWSAAIDHWEKQHRSKRRRKWDKMSARMDPEAKDLVESLLQYDPTKRITAHEALNHPFFTKHVSSLKRIAKEGVL